MIDYVVTFRKRGRKAYLALAGREIYLGTFDQFCSLEEITTVGVPCGAVPYNAVDLVYLCCSA